MFVFFSSHWLITWHSSSHLTKNQRVQYTHVGTDKLLFNSASFSYLQEMQIIDCTPSGFFKRFGMYMVPHASQRLAQFSNCTSTVTETFNVKAMLFRLKPRGVFITNVNNWHDHVTFVEESPILRKTMYLMASNHNEHADIDVYIYLCRNDWLKRIKIK